jgi:aryl-alcohol dehydrogenase-like predicted oxidoreductase
MLRLLKHAVDRGITFFDTSDVYMQGESEALGSALGPLRHDVVIATKAGFRRPIDESALARIRPFLWSSVHRVPAPARALTKTRRLLMRRDFSAQHLRKAVEGSLRRLAQGAKSFQ